MPDQATMPTANIDSVLQEQRKFEPPEEFRRSAHLKSLEEFPPSQGADTLSMKKAVDEAMKKAESPGGSSN